MKPTEIKTKLVSTTILCMLSYSTRIKTCLNSSLDLNCCRISQLPNFFNKYLYCLLKSCWSKMCTVHVALCSYSCYWPEVGVAFVVSVFP